MKPKPGSLDDLLAHAERYAELNLTYHGNVPGTLIVHGPTGPGIYVPRHLDGDQAKDNFAATARQIAIAHDASALVMVLEAWAVQALPGAAVDASIPPSQSPHRREVVALLGESHDGQKAVFLPIRRHAGGGFAGFGEAQVQAASHAEGRFARILPAHAPTPEERARAFEFLDAQGMHKELAAPAKVKAPGYFH